MWQGTHHNLPLMCSMKFLRQKVRSIWVQIKKDLGFFFFCFSNKKTLMSFFLWLKMLKLHLETQTMTKGMTCFLPLRQQNQQRITKETTASRNKDNLRRPPDLQRRQPHFRCQVSPHRTWETACYIMHRWAFKNSTPPTSCWRRFHAPWSFCLSRCSSWQRLSRSLCASRCSSSGRRCRFSETSQVEPLRSCMTNWMDGQRYSNKVSDRDVVKLYHWLHTWPSGAGTFEFPWTPPLVTVLFDSTQQIFCGYILKLYS